MDENKSNLPYIIVGLLILAAIAGAGWWYWQQSAKAPEPEPIKTSEDVAEAVTTPELEVGSNPLQNNVPEVNPIDRANPFKDAYQNPFE